MVRICFADVYRSVVAVTPTTSGFCWLMRCLKLSWSSFSAWQSMILASCPSFSATAARYARPSGMKGGCACWLFG